MQSLNILLLGVVHDYQQQKTKYLLNPPEKVAIYLAQLGHYAHWVRRHIVTVQPRLIFDEMNLPECEPFNRLVDVSAGSVPWVYMDIPEHVRKWFGLLGEGKRTRDKPIIPEIDEPRERHWLRTVESISAECNVDTIAVLCGAAHLPTFGQKLREPGHQVDEHDCRNETWYSEEYTNV